MKQRTCVLDESCSSGVLVRVLAASWVGICDCRFVLNEDALSAHWAFGVGAFGEGDESLEGKWWRCKRLGGGELFELVLRGELGNCEVLVA
jgi:hypothetical protein